MAAKMCKNYKIKVLKSLQMYDPEKMLFDNLDRNCFYFDEIKADNFEHALQTTKDLMKILNYSEDGFSLDFEIISISIVE